MSKPVEGKARPRAGEAGSTLKDGLPVLPSLAAIGELIVAFALIYGIDWLYPQLGVFDFQPHPFWIPLLLLSLQYGTVSGLVAAGAAIAASMSAGLPEAGIGENHFAYFLRVWGQPILWIAMALLVGQFRMRQIAAKQELGRLNEALAKQRDDLAVYSSNLRERCESLERALATGREVQSFEALAALREVDPAGDASAASQAVLVALGRAAFPDARLALYRLSADGLVRIAASPREPDRHVERIVAPLHPLHQAVVAGGASLSLLDRRDERALDGIALAAVPVPGATGAISGMLALESGSPDAIAPRGLRALEVLAEAIGQSGDFADARSANMVAPSLPAGRANTASDRPGRRRIALRSFAASTARSAVTAPAESAAASVQLAGSGFAEDWGAGPSERAHPALSAER